MADGGYDFDMLVIGSGPAGQRAAIQAAKLNKRAALVERKTVVGGVCINTGTIPSKTIREAVLHLSGYRLRGLYGASYTVKEHITMQDLQFRTEHVVRHEIDVTRHQLMRNQVEVFTAEAAFVDPHTVRLNEMDNHGAHGHARGQRRTRGHRDGHRGDTRRAHSVRRLGGCAAATTFCRWSGCRVP